MLQSKCNILDSAGAHETVQEIKSLAYAYSLMVSAIYYLLLLISCSSTQFDEII